MTSPYLGQINAVGWNFAARGWALCDGQLLPISQNTALFSLLGTTFGGDGRTTFGLPDLRGRVAKHVGNGAGLNPVSWGQRGGLETVTLTVSHMPSHNHTVKASNHDGAGKTAPGSFATPGNNFLGAQSADNNYTGTADTTMNSGMIANTGGGIPFNIENPYLGVYHLIALQGTFPSRN